MDPLLLSRLQFAFTISFHIIFPSLTIGLASWLGVLEGVWLTTRHRLYRELYLFWVKIFALAFGMGVVSGVVLSYQFGTNWSVFSAKVGNVIGPLLGYEVMTAFFLEASFLGIMLFGWNKVTPKMHFVSTLVVAVGTLISAFWILSANSWMQTPAGFEMKEDGLFYPVDWLSIIFNPSFLYRFVHMTLATYLATAFMVGGVAAWYLWRGVFVRHAQIMFSMAMLIAVFVPPLQLVVGDLHGLNTLKHQPAKIAAIEGIWEDERGSALRLWGWPDEKAERTFYTLEIPKLASLLLTHKLDGTVQGLKNWVPEDRPPVAVVFWSFRLMVGVGLMMLLTGLFALLLFLRGKLLTTRWFQLWCLALTPAGFIAILAGWFVTEVGRQPYVVYGFLRTKEAMSPIGATQVGLSLPLFVVVYSLVFGTGFYYIFRLIRKGPTRKDESFPPALAPTALSEIFYLSKKDLLQHGHDS